jgi:hypothetical protein
LEEKLRRTAYSASQLDLLSQPNEFDEYLNKFLKWVNSELRGGATPKLKALFISQRSWRMLRETVQRAGCNASEEIWRHTIVCPLYIFITTTGVHATPEQHEENLRHVLPVAPADIIEALARYDTIFFIQAPAERERLQIPLASLAFVCLSLLETWYNIPGALAPSTMEWLNEYSRTTGP